MCVVAGVEVVPMIERSESVWRAVWTDPDGPIPSSSAEDYMRPHGCTGPPAMSQCTTSLHGSRAFGEAKVAMLQIGDLWTFTPFR